MFIVRLSIDLVDAQTTEIVYGWDMVEGMHK